MMKKFVARFQLKRLGFVGLVLSLVVAGVLFATQQGTIAQPAPLIEPYLTSGQLAAGEAAMLAQLQKQPNDDKTRFSLGVVQVMRGLERLTQSLYRYGLREDSLTSALPILRLPIPTNKTPEVLTYSTARQILQTWVTDLNTAQTTLSSVSDPSIKLPLRIGLMKLDMDGNGKISNDETFWRIFAKITRIPVTEKQAQSFLIAFDTGDASWLQGYCNLLAAMGETFLAYDWKTLFESTGHLAFARVESPYRFLSDNPTASRDWGFDYFSDLIASIHLLNFPLAEPQRLTAALQHLQTTLALSRQSWKFILAEKDNEQEWIPNPKQKSVVPNVPVNPQMIESWFAFLDESDAMLSGKKLVPFWRGRDRLGVNLNRVFTEPRPFDMVLWVQGTAAAPYIEKGTLTTGEFWMRLMRVFGGNFFTFAVWFN